MDAFLRWLSSGAAYYLIALSWLASAIYFGVKARGLSPDNSGCYLAISTTVFTMIGGAIGLLLFKEQFPWYIVTSFAGAIVGPMLVIRTFKSGKRKY